MPWPIALLSLFYGVIATLSAATLWKTLSGASDRPLLWPAMWLALSTGVMCGLPLLKPWARGLAVAASALLVAITLAVAGVVVLAGRPLMALVATAQSRGVCGLKGILWRASTTIRTPILAR
ncbi:MAG: hypothetical protein HYY58_00040 [Candidatus Omnitrophica bacterium]|nr:hypothetical protein [Candidatus Omnitrophota bacterium]